MICLHCNHMENMDYIHGCGICAILEGKTVNLDEECICPKDIYDAAEAFLRANGKEDKCNEKKNTMSSLKEELATTLKDTEEPISEIIGLALESGLTKEQIKFVLSLRGLISEEAEVAILGFEEGLSEEQVKIFYNENYDHCEMLSICTALVAGVPEDELKDMLTVTEDVLKVTFEMTRSVLKEAFPENMELAKKSLSRINTRCFYFNVSDEARILYEKFMGAYVSSGYKYSGAINVSPETTPYLHLKKPLQELLMANVVQKRNCSSETAYELTVPYRFALIDTCKLDYVWSKIGGEDFSINNGYYGELHSVVRKMASLSKVPDKLYHATFGAYLKSVNEEGLITDRNKTYVDCKPGYVYLTEQKDNAISFCEAADDIPEEIHKSGVYCFEVDMTTVDKSLAILDPNILDIEFYEEGQRAYAFKGNIPKGSITLI